ncbi:MAG: bifunctional UDP-sugar hydrolase/5'-nucleotidase [Deltaproteobacteria bacterium]|nr:bifunctional UDP-sugar hydrolase/5'-nucleotidase [Deltaproteobacteria bacterium]
MRRRFPLPLFLLPLLLIACSAAQTPQQPEGGLAPGELTLFFTTDEHGHIAAREKDGRVLSGAANLAGHLKEEGFSPDAPGMLLLSGGDSWTGPAVSAFFQGESTVEIFDALGYDAAALGNHDFDFGQAVLAKRLAQAHHPIVSANVLTAEGEPLPGIAPYQLLETGPTKVGILGISYPGTPRISVPENVAGLTFGPALAALEANVPKMREEGAQVVVVLTHMCGPALLELAPRAAELGVAVMFGGHCHERVVARKDGVLVVEGGHYLEQLHRVDLKANPETGALVDAEVEEIALSYPAGGKNPVTPDPAIQATVDRWTKKIDEHLGKVIGHTESGIEVGAGMYAMVTDAWLGAYPRADIALSNTGAFRQNIPPGPITLADVVAVLPFENSLVVTEISGAELLENLACCGGAVAGLTYELQEGEIRARLSDGSPLDPGARYRVLINSFMYGGGDGYLFGKQDPDAEDTSIHWRDPVIGWIQRAQTSKEKPLEQLLEDRTRFRPLPRPTEGAPAE